MEADPRGDLLLIREGEMERERLQKEGFNMKLRINFLEEQLLKYKEGTAFEDEDFESENMHLRAVVEEKVQELERRNFLLVRARDAIEVLRADLEAAKEHNRLNESTNMTQLEETSGEVLRLEADVARLEEELQATTEQLDALRQKYDDLMQRYSQLDLQHTEQLRIAQRLTAEKERANEEASWEVQRARNEMKLAHDAQLRDEKEQWHQERMQIAKTWETKLREKEVELDRARTQTGDRDDVIKTLQQSKMELELALEKTTKQRDAGHVEIQGLQLRLQRAAADTDESYGLRRQCDQLEADVATLRKQLQDQELRAKSEIDRQAQEMTLLREQKQQMADEMSLQTDKVKWETLQKLEAAESTNARLGADLQRASAELQRTQDALFKAHAAAAEWETKANATASEWQAKLEALQQTCNDGAVAEREQAKLEERNALLQSELADLREAERQLRGSFQLAMVDIASNKVLLDEREKSLAMAQQDKKAFEATVAQETARWKQQRQALKAKIQSLEAERSQIHLQSKDEAQSLVAQIGHMHGLKEQFASKSHEMDAGWQVKAGQLQGRIDVLQDRLAAATSKIAHLQAIRDGSQQQRFDQLKYEAMQAKLQWEQELLQVQKSLRDETSRADQHSREAREAQMQLQQVDAAAQQKVARLEAEYQRVLRSLAALRDERSKAQPELHRRDEHIRLLKEEVEQSKGVQADLAAQLRSAVAEHAQYRARIDDLQRAVARLQEKERATEQLVRQQCQRNEALLDRAAPTASPALDLLESLVRKTRELVEHTRRFQDKYAAAWPGVVAGAQAMSAAMDHDCGRLLRANTMLCHKLAQVVAEFKLGGGLMTPEAAPAQVVAAAPPTAPPALRPPVTSMATPLPGSSQRQRASLSQAELEALVHTLHESKAPSKALGVPPLAVVPGTARILDAYQSSNSVLSRLNKELLKVHNTIEGYSRPPPPQLR
ncbi:hypothetical protein ACHHYP_01319 [Achlya hypogyna]|uniref:Centrosomin N-terminal motif 1 domain-containing protein n=1 Tax=Achlya hypogyna TaxID=1202772 RepID=A0A1V9Z8S9_ACHHY|nr:hypothetical protein ACHHYP_01319 [Achlya hypogyna]